MCHEMWDKILALAIGQSQEAQPDPCSLLSVHTSTTLQQDISYPKKLTIFHREITLLIYNFQN